MSRVLLVDDHPLVRQGIRSLLELTPDLQVVGEASDGAEALALIASLDPDVTLLDVRMPGMDGLAVLRSLRARDPGRRVLLLTTFDDDAVVIEALRVGVQGFLLKDVGLAPLAEAVRRVARGETLPLPAATERALRSLATAGPASFPSAELPDALTAREQEVLRLMARGLSNREISLALGTAEGTVKNQASSILSKLGVRDRTRAVLRAVELGYL
ncbi:response regulator transcription factor [Aggregicoccus sp. 17bor-14]|uniref:response regulator n=1 Tax=Myxococcaceae TaxID=31 RepID=UPI00129CC7ED|nr:MULTISPECIES: response regulator transcription factor [Myxococcaceae]MBF5045529.1 response regulator transcription factor [Simulacricoccus sp. 17bor-14]MRI91266.1 response regulator transcription factor [Aggregicoccus sp. 17bor-14]